MRPRSANSHGLDSPLIEAVCWRVSYTPQIRAVPAGAEAQPRKNYTTHRKDPLPLAP